MVKTSYLGILALLLCCLTASATEQRGGLLSGLSSLAGAVRQADLAAPAMNLDANSSPDLGSIDTALEDWKAHAEAAVRAVYELQQQQEDQDDVPLVAYEHAVDMVHATADRLHDLRTHLEAANSSPDASLSTALQQAEEVLIDAQEHVKDAGVYFNHGAKKTAQLELQAALQEVEDAERYVQQHGAPQDPHALASRMIAAMHSAFGVLSAQAERLHNLAVYAAPHASSSSSRDGEEGAQSCPQGTNGSAPHQQQVRPCAFNGDRLYQQAQILLGRLATAVHELQHYEKSGADAATITASAHTAEAFTGALSHMERWQDDPSSAYDEAIDGSSHMAEACRAATRLANESVRTLRQFGPPKSTVGHLLGGRQVLAKGAAPRAKWEL